MKQPVQNVAILGASNKPERYALKAQKMLMAAGHRVIPVTPAIRQIEGVATVPALASITSPIDTLTVYVGSERLVGLIDDIVQLCPGRVILNPGTESAELEAALSANQIPFEHACTLVLLKTGQF